MCYYYLGPDLGRTRTAVSDVDRMARLRAQGGCWYRRLRGVLVGLLSVVKTLKNERKRREKRERGEHRGYNSGISDPPCIRSKTARRRGTADLKMGEGEAEKGKKISSQRPLKILFRKA